MAAVLRVAARSGRDEGVPDGDLLARYVDGQDHAAFASLVRRHAGMVLGIARRMLGHEQDAEDVCQATFLLLVRKSSRGLRRESVAGWLCATARLTALNARKAKARRARAEARSGIRAAGSSPSTPLERMTGAELVSALDEELARLPDRYRGPLVLCCLEGLARDDAARRLGVPVGTLRVQLERARERLRTALGKRGVELGAALLAVTLASAVRAAPAQVVESIMAAVGGTVRPAVAAPPEGITTMTKTKLFLAAVLGIGLAVAAGVGANVGFAPAAKTGEPPTKERPSETKSTVRGRVMTHDGKPAAAAKLFLINNDGLFSEVGAAGKDGRFAVEMPQTRTPSGKLTWLAARAPGFGVDFVALNDRTANTDVELRLPADLPIRGRVIDLQGKPVVGATVRLNALSVYGADTVEPFLAGLLKRPDLRSYGAPSTRAMWGGTRQLLTATTGKDGRFVFTGAGAERVVDLRIAGPGIAQTSAEVITRAGFDPEPYNAATRALLPKSGQRVPGSFDPEMLLGPEPTVVAENEKPIRGVVTDAGTGKPRAGVRVRMDQDKGTLRNWVEATTDKDGRYEIHGAFKAASYTLTVESDPATGFVRRSVTVRDPAGYEPVVADIQTARGVVITGQVIDRATGKAAPGRVWVGPLFDNPHLKKPEYDSFDAHKGEEAWAGDTFRIVAIPGPVLLMGGPDYSRLPGGMLEGLQYRLPTADPRFPNYFQSDGMYLMYRPTAQSLGAAQGNYCKVLDIKPGVAEVRADVMLERDTVTRVSVRDGAGRPVAGIWMDGVTSQRFVSAFWCEQPEIKIYGVQKGGKPRLVTFFEPKNKLTATVTLKGDEKEPVVVTLGPPGILKGRLLTPDGTPAAGVTVRVLYQDNGPRNIFREAQEPDGCVLTDKDGTFRFERMIPGGTFTLWTSEPSRRGMFRTPARPFADGRIFGPVKAGETTDVGELTLKAATPGDKE
jgi:RNA polymerase sigma factor (sigma-70 family)